ncbi:unnamed protein product, partial [Mesorhabditis belari]|uniref:Uncharacterized protein n=1 Tax=Mesorhabditis belari TaxID=2138241 RepID=A0AAF3J8V1_9BILA
MPREEPDLTAPEQVLASIFQSYGDYINSLLEGAAVVGKSLCDFFGLPCDSICSAFSTVFSILFAILNFLFQLISGLGYLVRRLTRSDPLQFLLYSAIPWIGLQ